MKQFMMMLAAMVCMASPLLAEDMHQMHHEGMQGMAMYHADASGAADSRTSLNLPAPMGRKQLTMMREHLQAVHDIIAYIAAGEFDDASKTAHEKLGLTPEMKNMCNMFGNDDFRSLGLAFHQSADELGEVLKSKDVNRSLQALHKTMNYCISCHATFRQ